jgi:hypothetical protein
MMYDLGFIGGLVFFLCACAGVILGIQMTPGFWKAARVCFVAAFAGALLMGATLIGGLAVILLGH